LFTCKRNLKPSNPLWFSNALGFFVVITLEQVFKSMAKVNAPLGSVSAHGKFGDGIVFQGNVARLRVIPRDAKTSQQIETRTLFRQVARMMKASGEWAHLALYVTLGSDWVAKVYGWIRGNYYGRDSLYSGIYQNFTAEQQAEWDTYSPYLPGVAGMGEIFYRVLHMCYWGFLVQAGTMWGLREFGADEAQAAAHWWNDGAEGYFEPGIFDDEDSRIVYSDYWGTIGNPSAFEGAYHVGQTSPSTTCYFYFKGSLVRLHYVAYPTGATMKVVIDGEEHFHSQADPVEAFGHEWVSPVLTFGPHLVEITQSGVGFLTLDAVEIE
jgi:hypothetical protein